MSDKSNRARKLVNAAMRQRNQLPQRPTRGVSPIVVAMPSISFTVNCKSFMDGITAAEAHVRQFTRECLIAYEKDWERRLCEDMALNGYTGKTGPFGVKNVHATT